MSKAQAFLTALSKTRTGRPRRPVGNENLKLLVIGDSISIGYDDYMARSLTAVKLGVTVSHNAANAETSSNGVANIDSWLAANGGNMWDVVTFNHGLWDINHSRQVPLETYISNMVVIANKVKLMAHKYAFVTSTHVVDGQSDRLVNDIIEYNHYIKQYMEMLEIPIIDLYPTSYKYRAMITDDVHFTEVGYSHLGTHMASEVLRILGY